MDIYIHKDVIGFQNHLICQAETGKLFTVKEIPDDAPVVYGEESILEIAKLYGINLPSFPPGNYVKALQTVLGGRDVSQVPWHLAIPPGAFKRALETLGADLLRVFSGLDLTYYQSHYRRTVPVLQKMKRAKIDRMAWMVHSGNKDLVTPHVFHSFQPDEDWFAEEVVYSKCDTKTGRLKVMKGPNILLLPKDQRNILASRFGHKGKVMSLDFSSLEPRVVLFLKDITPPVPLYGNPPLLPVMAPETDIYKSVLTNLGITDIPRDLVKEVVLSQLYGAGYDTILEKLSGVRDPSGFVSVVEDFFGLNQLRERLLQEWEANGRAFILNHYGKRLDTRDAKPYMLLNYYVQSTAVDVALYGFRNILRALVGENQIVPLFILHDALILDVHIEKMEKLQELCEVGASEIPLFPGCKFPIKHSRF
jgi:hypothetical protein